MPGYLKFRETMLSKHINFILGNVVLVAALVFLIYMGKIWELIGPPAMLIWMAMVAVGITLLLKDRVD